MAQDQWAAFPDAPERPEDDEWADFPDAPPAPTPSRATRAAVSGGIQPQLTFNQPIATDGDTIRDGDVRVRLQGIDAPELGQRGWRSDGTSIALGEQSRDWLSKQLFTPENMRLASEVGQSYGRIVGPVTNDGQDIGLASLRAGQSYVVPDYISDEEQLFAYREAERLAARNRLGVHGTVTITPQEYREDPDYERERTTKGVWRDLPTPHSGLSKDDEQEWQRLLHVGTVEEISAFARSRGYRINEEYAPQWVESRDKYFAEQGTLDGFGIRSHPIYRDAPRELINQGDGATGATVRGYGDGFAAGGLDELGAVVDTLGATPGRENLWNSDSRWADIYWNNVRQNQAILAYDEAHHPGARLGGQVAGGLTSGFFLPYARGGASAAQLAKWGAGYGSATGFLGTDGGLSERLTGAAKYGTIGAIADPALGKVADAAFPAASRVLQGFRNGSTPETTPAPYVPRIAGEIDPELLAGARQLAQFNRPRTRAELMASASTVQPGDMLPMPSNVPEAGELAAFNASRFAPAKAISEETALERGTVTNWRGEPVPKVGPLDLVGWVRTQGGLRDSGGELSAMGFNNVARRGLEHVGQETRFGPLVNAQDGMDFDDAALAAWEAGYFPELTERPDVNTFLNAMRDTYEGGSGRRFLPEDYGQVEGFQAMRTERFETERAISESDAPLYQDRSMPAEERAFPPVEAYGDWAGDAIERVGNIDVTKLDSPQDIKRALKTTHGSMGGFDAATRGRISQGETERLADELGMSVGQLLSRRQGQAFNAEEALAARQILARSGNELVNMARRIQRLDNPGDEALSEFRQGLLRHTAIQEQVAGMTAEAGRTLQQFRQAANSRAVQGDVLSAFVRSGGGQGDLKQAAETLIEAAELSPGQFAATARRVNDPKFRDKIGELYINALLSNPPTHVVNMVSNAITSIAQIPEHAVAAGIGATRRAVMGERASDRILASEVGARAFGLLQGAREGMSLFARALRTGEADDFVSKVEGDQYRAIGGMAGEAIRVPTRLLTAEDQFFKGIARRMELNGQAVRVAAREGLTGEARTNRIAELVANPTDEMMSRSMDYGLYLTFQQQLGEAGQSISNFTNSFLPGKIVMPFVRTPINLLKFAAERSPAAPLLREWRADFRAGGERRDLAVGRALMGTGLAYSFYELAQQGLITGAAPMDQSRARLMYADGWQPYSIRVGDRYIGYSRLDPLSTTLGVAADMATLPENMSERQREDQSIMLVASIMNNLGNKTWLSGVSSLTAGLADPQRNAENWLERTVSAFATPAIMGGAARQLDPIVRQREGVGEAIQSRIPGMSDDLLPARNVFGEPRVNDSLGPDFLSPFWQSQSRNDPVVAEMLRIQKSVSAPGKQFTQDGERIDYPRETYDRYHEVSGRFVYNNLLALIGSERYAQMNDDERRNAAKRAIREARESARAILNQPDYPLPPRGAGATNAFQEYLASDPFASFPNAPEAAGTDPWAAFEDAPQ